MANSPLGAAVILRAEINVDAQHGPLDRNIRPIRQMTQHRPRLDVECGQHHDRFRGIILRQNGRALAENNQAWE